MKQNDIDNLHTLNRYQYENIFNVYQDDKTYYYYNILKNISFPEDINEEYYDLVDVNFNTPLTNLSYKYYGTINLWWIFLVVNNIFNPFLTGVKKIKVIKNKYIGDILNLIQQQL